jgi:hypothetical protein
LLSEGHAVQFNGKNKDGLPKKEVIKRGLFTQYLS